MTFAGTGNIGTDPEDDPDYADTDESDFRLTGDSPCIDVGDNAAVPADEYNVDGDENYDEPTPDLDLLPRLANGSNGPSAIVDMGAYEFQTDCNNNQQWDSVDIEEGSSNDCNANGIPDECEDCTAGGTIIWAGPADGTVDARWHHSPGEGEAVRHGIGEVGEEIVINIGVTGLPCTCFALCETAVDPNGGVAPNDIDNVVEDTPGIYTITLDRGITPLACTIITYRGDGSSVTYYKHPVDVTDNQTSDILDVAAWIVYYNDPLQEPEWGLYATDIDMNQEVDVLDLSSLIQLFNGSGSYDGDGYGPWMGVSWDRDCTACTGGGDGPAGGGGGSEGDPAEQLAESLVQFMTMSTPSNDEASDFADAALSLANYCVEHLNAGQRTALAHILEHGDTEYASDIACELVPEMIAALVD